jgi:ABC-2 type transport system ATP-binding protein
MLKQKCLIWCASALVCSGALAGTFSQFDTLIPVPASANATPDGDTAAATGNTIQLDARVYVPDGITAPAPVMVVVHGYGGSKSDGTVVAVAQDFASEGYVVLTPTMRGFGDSDGLVTLGGPNEVNDLKTIILAMQTGAIGDSPAIAIPVNSASKFGVAGASYGGGHAFEIMRTHVAGLAAVAPVIGWTDLYQALSPNDVPKLSFGIALFAGGFDTPNPNYDNQMFTWVEDLLGGSPEKIRTGDPSSNIDWRSVIFNPAQLSVPVFVVQGWHDWLFPAEQATALFQSTNAIPFFKMYIGGIGHPPASSDVSTPEALYVRTQLVRWFDHWLKGIDNGITSEPRVTIAPERSTSWSQSKLVTSDVFPLSGTTSTNYYFNGNRLASASGKGKPLMVKPGSDLPSVLQPIAQALGHDASTLIGAIIAANAVLNSNGDIFSPTLDTGLDRAANFVGFETAPLNQDVRVVGTPGFHLFVSATAANAIYYVQITEVTPDGTEHLVTRAAFKDHTKKFRKAHEIDFTGFGINRLFQAGNQINVRIASRDFPFFYLRADQPTIKVYRDTKHPSDISLPVVP